MQINKSQGKREGSICSLQNTIKFVFLNNANAN